MVESTAKHPYATRQTTHKNLKADEMTLQGKFLPPDYHQILFEQLKSCSQRNRTVATYAEKFYWLSFRYGLAMTEEQLATKYTSGLKYSIQKHVLPHNVFSLDET